MMSQRHLKKELCNNEIILLLKINGNLQELWQYSMLIVGFVGSFWEIIDPVTCQQI
jgi:hypothetical protein